MAKKYLPLIRINTPSESRVHLVDRERFTMGRSPDVDVVVISTSVSRKHLLVEVKNDTVFIEDLSSANGSFLNGVKLQPKQKYPVVIGTPIQLGTSNESITIELLDRPAEFEKFEAYLPKFNQNIQSVLNAAVKNMPAPGAAAQPAAVLKSPAAAPLVAAPVVASVASAESAKLSEELLKKSKLEAQKLIETSREIAEAEAHAMKMQAQEDSLALKKRAQEEVRKYGAEKLAQIKEDLKRVRDEGILKIKEERSKQLEALATQVPMSTREVINELKIQAQVEADHILQEAHKESARLKEQAAIAAEQIKLEIEQKVQTLLNESELEADKVLSHSREAAESMRQTARMDADELLARTQAQCKALLSTSEKETADMLEAARLKVQSLVEHQEKETKTILTDLKNKIESEGRDEREKLLLEAETKALENQKNSDLKIVEAQKAFDLRMSAAQEAFDLKLTDDLKAFEARVADSQATANAALQVVQEQKLAFDAQVLDAKNSLEEFHVAKASAQTELQNIATDTNRLKDENRKQIRLSEDLANAEQKMKTLELAAAQLDEKNKRSENDLELLKKRTFEELDKARRDAHKKMKALTASRAQDFASRIEKLIVAEINQMLPEALEGSKLHTISQKLNQELIEIFETETVKVEEARPLVTEGARPSVFSKPIVRWGMALSAVAVVAVLIKLSPETVQNQVKFTQNLIEKQREDSQYKPPMNNDYRQSYMDNILYMNQYVQIKSDSRIQDEWVLNLNEFFLKDLKLSEENMVRFIGIESSLIKRLVSLRASVDMKYLEEGLKRMQDAEKEDTEKMIAIVKTAKNYERLRLREKIFLSHVKILPLRVPAEKADSEKDSGTNADKESKDKN